MTNKLLTILVLLLAGSIFCQSLDAQSSRSSMLFNDDWKFHKGDIQNAQQPSFQPDGWTPVTLPHDWSIHGPFSEQWASATAFLPGGIGWYRKSFTLPASDRNLKVFIRFNGVYKDSKVWINGHFLGERPNGFITFQYDMTPYLHIGGKNIIAVRVNHSEYADSRWYTGSGIYRNVYLISTGKLHIPQWGISATTTQASAQSATLRVSVAVENESAAPRHFTLENILMDARGKTVGISVVTTAVAAGDTDTLPREIAVPHPVLWSTTNPVCYELRTLVRVGGKTVDEKTTRIGIRTIRFDPDKGFFLNGVNMKLKGVCVHDDAGCLGVAVPSDVWKRRLEILKAAGCNAIRLSHNPHAPQLYDLCDQMGFLLIDEAFDEWELGKRKWIKGWNVGTPGTDGYHTYFAKWADRDLRDMILRDRNHPSVIMWSIGNEIDYPNDPYSDPVLNEGRNPQIYGTGYQGNRPAATNLKRIATGLVRVVKRYDTTRPVTAGLAAVVMSDKVGYAQALDVVGYNYQEYRYPEDHARYPERRIYGSENGMSYQAWEAVADHDYVAGQFLWTGIDYLGEAARWPSRSNGAGLLDLAGFRKPEYYFRQSIWTKKPMIYIGTARIRNRRGGSSIWTHKRADPLWNYSTGDSVMVNCFTNCREAELFLNGRSLGRKPMEDSSGHVISWVVPYQPGTLSVKGYSQGREAAQYELRTYGTPTGLQVKLDTGYLKADGQRVAHLTITVVDGEGVRVYDGDNEITCEVKGPGKLLGLESGDSRSHESYTAHHRKAYHGKLLGYIQSTNVKGEIRVTVSAPGLGSKILHIRTR